MYLRILPTVAGSELSAFEVAEADRKVSFRPLNRIEPAMAPRSLANQYGYISYFARGTGQSRSLLALSQLFWNREIWGVNYVHLMPNRENEYGVPLNFVPMDAVYSTFSTALANYLRVLSEGLQVPLPVEVLAGFVGVRGMRLTMPRNYSEQYGGELQTDEIHLPLTQLKSPDVDPHDVLRPLYTRLWQEAGHAGIPKGSF